MDQIKSLDGLDWADVNKTIMFDDDSTALSEEEQDRLVTVVSYDHWAKCPWDENVNEEMLARNPDSLADIVRARFLRIANIFFAAVTVTGFLDEEASTSTAGHAARCVQCLLVFIVR